MGNHPTAPGLTAGQQDRASAARALLDEEPPGMYELAGMAERAGRLEYHLSEMLALVAELAGRDGTP